MLSETWLPRIAVAHDWESELGAGDEESQEESDIPEYDPLADDDDLTDKIVSEDDADDVVKQGKVEVAEEVQEEKVQEAIQEEEELDIGGDAA